VSASATPVDGAARERIRTQVGQNMLVEAGAGTGKTTSLVARITEVLASGQATVDELAVITFTNKAAAELSARVRERLEEALGGETDPGRRARLAAAVRGLYRARIETIHSFATSLLRERPVEAGLDPEFRALSDLESELMFERAFGEWLTRTLAEDRPEIARALHLGIGPDELRAAALEVHRHRYLLPLEPFEGVPDAEAEVFRWLDRNRAELEQLRADCDPESRAYPYIEAVLDYADELEALGRGSVEAARRLRAGLPKVNRNVGRQSDFASPERCQRWKKELAAEWQELAGRVPGQMGTEALLAVLPLVEEFVRDYEQERRAEGVADYDDLIIWSRDLVRDRPEVRDYFRQRFRAILIDEFQDTDPIQVELALYLASDSDDVGEWRRLRPVDGKLFVVGDPKQSIYRFRRADIAIYDEVKAGALGGCHERIEQNFRSAPRLIEWVNRAFEALFEERTGLQPASAPLVPSPFPEGVERPPVVVVRGEYPEADAGAVREREAQALAAVLREAVTGDEPWTVRDRGTGRLREPTWRDVAILLPQRSGIEAFEEALAAAGIPYRHEGARDYFRRDEVRELIFILRAIDDPRDRLSLVGALRSGAFGCSDDDLVIHLATGGTLSIYSREESESERVVQALAMLRRWHYDRERLSVPLLVQRVISESRLVEVALTGRDGAQAAANLLAIAEQARAFSSARGGGLRPFIRWLAENTERRSAEVDAGIAEETDEVARIMTIHSAKGLEFPIVALANLGTQRNPGKGAVPREAESRLHFRVSRSFETPGYSERWDEERAALAYEQIRLLYVAATRARDHLVIGDFRGKRPGPLLAALDEVLPQETTHRAEVDGVWMLEADRLEPPAAEAAQERRPGRPAVEGAREERDRWSAEREQLIKAARKGLELEVASSVKRELRPLAAEASSADATLLVSEGPPLAVGDALHKVMERITLPGADDLELWAEAVCAEFGIPGSAGDVIEMARRCLESPSVRAAIESGTCQREVPFTLASERGYTVGRVDLVARNGDGLVVIDYKTDVVTAERAAAHTEEHHGGQAQMYAEGIETATGLAVSQVVFVYCRAGAEVALRPGEAGW